MAALLCGRVLAVVVCFAGLVRGLEGRAAGLVDVFADREVLAEVNGSLTNSNVGATNEPGEPRHAGKPGGSSVWISWVAPTNGIATFRTRGSSFDTLLAAYYFKPSDPQTLDKLQEVAANDEDPGTAPASRIEFAALSGRRYEIAVDGYRGASGTVVLEWDFVSIGTEPPIIVSVPGDRALRVGDPVTLSVGFQAPPDARLQWRYNGDSFGAEGPTLVIPSLQATNVGLYSLRIRIGNERFETAPVEIQINSEGQTNALARDKFFDSLGTPLTPDDHGGLRASGAAVLLAAAAQPFAVGAGVTRGYNGTQIFNTTYATPDPDEPAHCGGPGGASYWYGYQAPTNGTLFLDTIGSSYDTVLAVYRMPAGAGGLQDLIPIACDNDAVSLFGASRVQVEVQAGQLYLIEVDGVNGARGIAHLSYRLESTPFNPQPFLAAAGSYQGIFHETNHVALESSGLISLFLRGSGAFSGSVRQAGRRIPFTGRLNAEGLAALGLSGPGSNALALELALLSGEAVITGGVSGAGWATALSCRRAMLRPRSQPATNWAGRYTLLIPGAEDAVLAPAGDGIATANVSRSGAMSLTAILADGTGVTQAAVLSEAGEFPFFVSLRRGRGMLLGGLRVRPLPDVDLDGPVCWLRSAEAAAPGYTNGFVLMSQAIGSAFRSLGVASSLSPPRVGMAFSLGEGLSLAANEVSFGPHGRGTNHGPNTLTLRVNPAVGRFRGTVSLPGRVQPTAYRGVVLQRQQGGGGFFVSSNLSGRVSLGP